MWRRILYQIISPLSHLNIEIYFFLIRIQHVYKVINFKIFKNFILLCILNYTFKKAVAPHSSTLAWKIPWTEEPGWLESMGLLRVGHDWATSLSLFTFVHWRRKWQPTPVVLPGEFQGQGSLVGCRLRGRTVGHDLSDLAAAAAAVILYRARNSLFTYFTLVVQEVII